MAQIKFKVEIKKKVKAKAEGIELKKLSELANDIFSFLETFAKEISLTINPEHWIAKKFKNNSLDFDVVNRDEVEEDVRIKFNKDFDIITKAKSIKDNGKELINKRSLEKFSQIGRHIDFNETIRFGLYKNGNDKSIKWNELNKEKSLELEKNLRGYETDIVEDVHKYYGGIKGVIHNWYIEKPIDKDKPFVKFRRTPENDLVSCYYDNEMYSLIQSLTKSYNQTIILSGWVTAQRSTREILSIDIKNVSIVEDYQAGDLDKFLGCAKGITGGLSSEKYISMGRDE